MIRIQNMQRYDYIYDDAVGQTDEDLDDDDDVDSDRPRDTDSYMTSNNDDIQY